MPTPASSHWVPSHHNQLIDVLRLCDHEKGTARLGVRPLGDKCHRRLEPQPLHFLAGDSCDEFKILVHVQHREPGQFGG